jgi:hypothetical protein
VTLTPSDPPPRLPATSQSMLVVLGISLIVLLAYGLARSARVTA